MCKRGKTIKYVGRVLAAQVNRWDFRFFFFLKHFNGPLKLDFSNAFCKKKVTRFASG